MRKPTGKSNETLAPLMTAALKGTPVWDQKNRAMAIERIEGNCYYAKCRELTTGKIRGIVIHTLRLRIQ